MNQQITQAEMCIKLIGFGLTIMVFLTYLVLRYLRWGWRFLSSGQTDERKLIEKDHASQNEHLKELQNGPWMANTEMTINYASFGLNVIILAVVFIFEQRLTGNDALMFDFLLSFTGISAMFFFLSLQCWFIALDHGGGIEYRLQFRKRATFFQTVGWISLLTAGVYSILIISTVLGAVFCFATVGALIYIFELKFRYSLAEEYQTESAKNQLNEFQRIILPEKIYVKGRLPVEELVIPECKKLRIITWNIERGYNLAGISSLIIEKQPDFVCIQEVDWNNKRTGHRDVLEDLAQATGMVGLFGMEFFEIDSPYRTKRMAGGGVHGNALLSKYNPLENFQVKLPELYQWETHETPSKLADIQERRLGSRNAVVSRFKWGERDLIMCSTHLEDKAGGVSGRIKQFSSIMQEVQDRFGKETPVIIAGDMNTFDNKLTRLVRISNAKDLDTKQAGKSECEWWKKIILPQYGMADPFACKQWTIRHGPFKFKLDWICTKNCKIIDCGVDLQHFSDHHLLWVDIQ